MRTFITIAVDTDDASDQIESRVNQRHRLIRHDVVLPGHEEAFRHEISGPIHFADSYWMSLSFADDGKPTVTGRVDLSEILRAWKLATASAHFQAATADGDGDQKGGTVDVSL